MIKIKTILLSICLVMILGGNSLNCGAQTLSYLEKSLSQKKISIPNPPPPRGGILRELWDDSWDDWDDAIHFWGASYNYSKQYPVAFSIFYHKRLLFIGLDLGFTTGIQSHEANKSEIVETNLIIYNGSVLVDDVIEMNTHYIVNPYGYFALQPGLNFNIITLSCGLGIGWGKYTKETGNSSIAIGSLCGGIINPNATLHIPIIGTGNRIHLTVNGGYQFMLAFNYDEYIRRLASSGNGWKFGIGLEFRFD